VDAANKWRGLSRLWVRGIELVVWKHGSSSSSANG